MRSHVLVLIDGVPHELVPVSSNAIDISQFPVLHLYSVLNIFVGRVLPFMVLVPSEVW